MVIAPITTVIGMMVSIIVVAITGAGCGNSSDRSNQPLKGKNKLTEWLQEKLNRLAEDLKQSANKVIDALLGIIESVIGAILWVKTHREI